MLKIEDVMKRLNFIEQKVLRDYLSGESLKNMKLLAEAVEEQTAKFKELNNNTWECISKLVEIALTEHNISRQRINKINDRIAELSVENSDELLLDAEQIEGHEVMKRDEYEDLIEELVDCKCKGCTGLAKDCTLRPKLDKRKVPAPSGHKGKCKYQFE